MLNPLNHHYSLENPASIYDEEAMTALQLAGRTTGKVNECVKAFNELEDSTKDSLDKIPGIITQEVDKNITGGAFDKAIDAYAGELTKRVDNLLGSVTNGSTTLDAEVIDTRVGFDGTAYPHAGDAIRNQVGHLLFEVGKDRYYNRIDPDTISPQAYVSNDGVYGDNPQYWVTDYIRVRPGERLAFLNREKPIRVRFVAFFDNLKNPVSPGDIFTQEVCTMVVPEVSYIRVTFRYMDTNPQDACIIEESYGNYMANGLTTVKTGNLWPEYPVENACHYNRIVPDMCLRGGYPDFTNGNFMPNDVGLNYVCSNFILVSSGESLAIYDNLMRRKPIRMIAVYKTTGEHIPELSTENIDIFTNYTNDQVVVRIALDGALFNNNQLMVTDPGCTAFLQPGEFTAKNAGNTAQLNSMIGGSMYKMTSELLSTGDTIYLDAFPAYLKKNVGFAVTGKISTMFNSLTIGHGGEGAYNGLWFEITQSGVNIHHHTNTTTTEQITHNVLIGGWITVTLTYQGEKGALEIISRGGHFRHEFEHSYSGTLFVKAGQSMTQVTASASCADFSKPLWLVGDSYLGTTAERVVGQLQAFGYHNYLVLAQPGLNSQGAYYDLDKALRYGKPKTLVWYMGMNDGATAEPYDTYFNAVKDLCRANNVELILNKVPTVPGINKDAINAVVEASGCRYIDSYGAVGANANGWDYTLLSADNVHPTEAGARVLAAQMLVDVPEIMSYGKEKE